MSALSRAASSGSAANPGRWLGHLAITLLCLWLLAPLLRCGGDCFARVPDAATDSGLASVADQRLNSWILAWDVHAVRSANLHLFDAPAFYPALDALTGSEHMLGVALPLVPLSLWRDDGVFLHQAATLLSFLLLGNGTFALLWWVTGSAWAAACSAVLAMFLPWRLAEVSHVQLLSVEWLPFLLLGLLEGLTGTLRRRDSLLLFVVTTLQLLSSFYLAYFVTLVVAAVVVAGLAQRRTTRAGLARTATALGAAYAVFGVLALPYLGRSAASDLHTVTILPDSLPLAHLREHFLMPWLSSLDWRSAADLHYQLPLPALLLAIAALLIPIIRRPSASRSAARILVVALPFASAVALLLSLGTDTNAAAGPHFLANLLRDFVPGYSNLRGYPRWLLVLSWATAILAGVGIAAAGERIEAGARGTSRIVRGALYAVTGLMVALSIPWFRVETSDAWGELRRTTPALEKLAKEADGVVLHAPWKDRPKDSVDAESLFLLAQTLDWRHPMLGGETAYPPPSYAVLHAVGDLLPAPSAVARLHALTGLRWILVHRSLVDSPREWEEWKSLSRDDAVTAEYEDDASLLLRVNGVDTGSGPTRERWTRPDARVTVSGISRSRLDAADANGELAVVDSGACLRHDAHRWTTRMVLDVKNGGSRDWPGIDPKPEGLVHVDYRYDSTAAAPAMAGSVPLLEDVPAGSARRILVQIPCPAHDGSTAAAAVSGVTLSLSQSISGAATPLAVPPVVATLR